MPKSISSVSGYITVLKSFRPTVDEELFFRGHPKSSFALRPSVFRNEGHKNSEREMLMRLIASSPEQFTNDSLTFDKLVRAQHYGIPTRLLDLTTNPLTALYFACSEHSGARGQVIVFKVTRRLVHFFNADSVSCKSNQAFLSPQDRVDLEAATKKFITSASHRRWRRAGADRDDPDYHTIVQAYNELGPVRRLWRVIRDEKSYFDPRLEPLSVNNPSFVFSKRSNLRINAQSGAFVIFGVAAELPDTSPNLSYRRIDIAADKKAGLLQELSALGVDQSSVYPELEKVAAKINQLFASI